MEVVHVAGYCVIAGDVIVVFIFGRSNNVDVAEEFGFFDSFVGPYAGVEVSCFFSKEVHRNHGELEACAAAQEEHTVTLGDVEEFFEECSGLVYYGLELFAAV